MAYASPVFSFICARCAVVTRLSSSFFFSACFHIHFLSFHRLLARSAVFPRPVFCWYLFRCLATLWSCSFRLIFLYFFFSSRFPFGFCFLGFVSSFLFLGYLLLSVIFWSPLFPSIPFLFIYLFFFFSRPRFDVCRRRVHPSRAAICWPLGALAGGCRVSRLYVFFSFCSIISSTFSSFLFCLASSSRFRLLFFFLVFFFCVAVSFVLSS